MSFSSSNKTDKESLEYMYYQNAKSVLLSMLDDKIAKVSDPILKINLLATISNILQIREADHIKTQIDEI